MLKGTIIVIPFTLPWDHTADYQRQTCLELARRGQTVIAYMAEEAHFFLKPPVTKKSHSHQIIFHYPTFWLPLRRFEFINRLNYRLDQTLLNLKYFFTPKIIWIFDPQFYSFPSAFGGSQSLYDCVDYHSSTTKKVDQQLRQQEKQLIKKVDHFFVNNHSLLKLHRQFRQAVLVPQGTKVSAFLPSQKNQLPHQQPVIGYLGGINHRLDFKLLFQLISHHPDWLFEFWGPIQADEQDDRFQTAAKISILKKLPNTSWKLARNNQEISQALSGFDACLIPYDISQPINFHSFPMKTFEYFIFGKPVISTPIQELTRPIYKELIFIEKNWQGFEKRIQALLNEKWPKEKIKKQMLLARAHSWRRKIDQILVAIQGHSHFKK